jgi:hypothetical protein
MNKRLFGFIVAFLVFLFSVNFAFADDTIKNLITNNYRQGKDTCQIVKKLITEKTDTKEVVKLGIQLGHNSCLVVKCALDAGGKLEEIIAGAYEAGTSFDVIARCAVDAGADPRSVAGIISDLSQQSLYFETELPMEPIGIGLPGEGTQGGGIISPFNF